MIMIVNIIHLYWTEANIETQWKNQWNKERNILNTQLRNHQDMNSFAHYRQQWTGKWTEQGRSNYLLHKWGMSESSLCDCRDIQMTRHVVETGPLMKFDGSLRGIHDGGENAIEWLVNLDVHLWRNSHCRQNFPTATKFVIIFLVYC